MQPEQQKCIKLALMIVTTFIVIRYSIDLNGSPIKIVHEQKLDALCQNQNFEGF